ncbi:MAG: DUF1937 family protein [Lactobacillaceae bacterium]|jgi:hypothetical protein|nr:DUF1937 family protein [Lactobacillaceae bacterium]
MERGYYFLANPYNGTEEEKNTRFEQTCKAAAHLLRNGVKTYSPTIHNNVIVNVSGDWTSEEKKEFLMPFSLTMLDKSQGLILLMLDGWEKSAGILKEIEYCKNNKIPVYKFAYDELMNGGQSLEKLK